MKNECYDNNENEYKIKSVRHMDNKCWEITYIHCKKDNDENIRQFRNLREKIDDSINFTFYNTCRNKFYFTLLI